MNLVLMKNSKDFEVIWVSHDYTSDDFVKYYQKMPWLAMAADQVAGNGGLLSEQFGVRGIPALVLLDVSDPESMCTVITTDGVTKVTMDPYALEFPYKPRLGALKALVPKRLRRFISRKKESSLATIKSTFNGAIKLASPTNLVIFILRLLKGALYKLLSVVFPSFSKKRVVFDSELR
jgi:hypothetical protein